ncbi:hypothetical protein D1007_54016 [Hordeum vulgare]|nr:hypothetical protein D1007_54016 [Hordeum vulgare]
MEEMAILEGEERAFQEKRVKDLLDAANQQHARLDPSQAQSESRGPNSGARRNPSAIQYFIDSCRDGTLLKHELMCIEPTSLVVLMAKAGKYATADSAMRVKVAASDKVVPTPAGDNRGGQNNYKRKADQMDLRSKNKLVASVEGETSAPQAGPPRKRPNRSNTNWLPK